MLILIFINLFTQSYGTGWSYLSLVRLYSLPPTRISLVDFTKSVKSPVGIGFSIFQATRMDENWGSSLFPLSLHLLFPLDNAEPVETHTYAEVSKAYYYPFIFEVYGGGAYWLNSSILYSGVDLEYSPIPGICVGAGIEYYYDIKKDISSFSFGLNFGLVAVWMPVMGKE